MLRVLGIWARYTKGPPAFWRRRVAITWTFARLIGAAAVLAIAAACGAAALDQTDEPAVTIPYQDRAVTIDTTGCGHASGRTGSGAAIGDDLIVTVAHLVVQSRAIEAAVGGAGPLPADVVSVDLTRDLALLRVPGLDLPTVATAVVGVGAGGVVVGGAASGSTTYHVTEVVDISIEEVLGTDRHQRRGYALDAATESGDSGAGAYNDAGQLIGIVFAFSAAPQVTWVTASGEVMDFVATTDPAGAALLCDPELSRLALPGR